MVITKPKCKKKKQRNIAQIVVRSVPKKRKNRRNKTSRGVRSNLMDNYLRALMDPVSADAIGVKAPNPYSVASNTFRNRTKVVITPDTNGNWDFVYMGRPFQTAFKTTGTLTAGALTPYGAATNWYYAEDVTSLGAKMSSFRVVANGLRIKNIQAPGTAIGQIVVARVPMSRNLYGPNLLATTAPSSNNYSLQQICGISTDDDGFVPLTIEDLPGAEEYDIAEVLGREIIVANKPTSGCAFDFSTTNDQVPYNGNKKVAQEIEYDASTGLVQVGDTNETTTSAGWTCILIRGVNFPTGATTKCIELELVSHVEGEPKISKVVGGAALFVPDTTTSESWPVAALNSAMSFASKMPMARLIDVVARGVTAYRDYKQGGLRAVADRYRGNGGAMSTQRALLTGR